MSSKVRIFRPSKNAMQSGRSNTRVWKLEFEPSSSRSIDPLMGWTGSADPQSMLRLEFDSKEEAVAFAERKGLEYRVDEPKERKVQLKNYSDNFSPNRLS
jgi:hypothetical protein